MVSRRDFLKHASLIALAPSVPAFLCQSSLALEAEQDRRILVVIQLDGGNDGINTIVPFADEGYVRNRKRLRLPANDIIRIDEAVGFHPEMRDAADLLDAGRLTIVQGVGYPNPNRSHDVSMAIWHTCQFDRDHHKGTGWIGRALDKASGASDAPASVMIGRESPPVALRGRRSLASMFNDINDLILGDPSLPIGPNEVNLSDDDSAFIRRCTLAAHTTANSLKAVSSHKKRMAHYPATELGQRLSLVAQLIKAGFETRVYYVVQPGYDTHYVQLPMHGDLLSTLSRGVRAFIDDLAESGLDDRVVVLMFSEFGRRVEENGSLGTDHGTAGPVFLAGGRVKPGLVGPTPSLLDLLDGDLKSSIDFRTVYAAILEQWLELPAADAIGGQFRPIELFSSDI